ncbi:MAG: hypothetical protein HZC38_08255 [Chloroflexi bacterium]|nr:hypothetical protein [Chloroflexota bacterium]
MVEKFFSPLPKMFLFFIFGRGVGGEGKIAAAQRSKHPRRRTQVDLKHLPHCG